MRKYVRAAQAVGLVRGGQLRCDAGWEQLTRQAIACVATVRRPGEASREVARFMPRSSSNRQKSLTFARTFRPRDEQLVANIGRRRE